MYTRVHTQGGIYTSVVHPGTHLGRRHIHQVTPLREAKRKGYTLLIPFREARREVYTLIYSLREAKRKVTPYINPHGG